MLLYFTNMPSGCFSIAEKKSWNEKIIGGNSFKEILNSIEYVWIFRVARNTSAVQLLPSDEQFDVQTVVLLRRS